MFTVLNVAQKLCKGSFRRLATSIYYLTIAVGHLVTAMVLSFGWFPNDATYFSDDATVQTYFFVLGGFLALGIIVFVFVIYRMIDFPSNGTRDQ